MRVKSHLVTRKENVIEFWDTGQFAARDEKRRVILENGHPKMNIRPPPLDKGFVETEYRPSADLLSQELGIPNSVVLTTFWPVRHEKEPSGIRIVTLKEFRIENRKVEFQPIPESRFVPTWTNNLAVVADFRREGSITGQPMSYLTKSNYFDPNEPLPPPPP
jgi:hypothetical protein